MCVCVCARAHVCARAYAHVRLHSYLLGVEREDVVDSVELMKIDRLHSHHVKVKVTAKERKEKRK